jgi:hypothetical protein
MSMLVILVCALLDAGALSLPLDAWRTDQPMAMQDAYKWIYQATMGGEHAASDRAAAARWLQQEWESLDAPAPDEPMIEPLGTSGVVRLNLRPYRAAGGSPQAVLDAFLESATSYRPDKDTFLRTWHELGEYLRTHDVGRMTRPAWERLDAETRSRGYPAVHHSDTYTRAHRPAYRVLTAEQAARLVQPAIGGPRARSG